MSNAVADRTAAIKGFHTDYATYTAEDFYRASRGLSRDAKRNAGYLSRTPAWKRRRQGKRVARIERDATRLVLFEAFAEVLVARGRKQRPKDEGPVRLREMPFKEVEQVFDLVDKKLGGRNG